MQHRKANLGNAVSRNVTLENVHIDFSLVTCLWQRGNNTTACACKLMCKGGGFNTIVHPEKNVTQDMVPPTCNQDAGLYFEGLKMFALLTHLDNQQLTHRRHLRRV